MRTLTLIMCSLVLSVLSAQTNPAPVYRVTVVSRTTKAVNYHHRSGPTNIDFRGTALLPEARGEARVESRQGVIRIDARMDRLQPASRFGPEYLTYVLWAITPEGRPTNLGEILLNGDNSKINTTSELQSFGLIVTAEPYFAVTQPSDVVVMENFIRRDTTGTIEEVDAKYELLQRGQYTLNVNPTELRPRPLDPKTPLELHEARNAVQIARWAGAEHYAPDTFQKAIIGLQNAEGYLIGKGGKKPIGTVAREAVQMAEDARLITVRKIEDERRLADRATAEEQERRAQQEAIQRSRAESERAAAVAESDRAKREAEAARVDAEQAAQRAAREKLAAESARAELEQAERRRRDIESEQMRLRIQLRQQFEEILETRDTARGLIMNMSDVLFDTAKFTLRPQAREKLAKISGILLAHRDLTLAVEGHTDSVGGEAYNQTLSEQRAASVRDYLVQQGIALNSVSARGFGKTQPVASNDTAEGRQRNRRVELVVSGAGIGTSANPTPTSSLHSLPPRRN